MHIKDEFKKLTFSSVKENDGWGKLFESYIDEDSILVCNTRENI